jgi:1-acyl-sn-glycerol-3-phosphate acyltransferase
VTPAAKSHPPRRPADLLSVLRVLFHMLAHALWLALLFPLACLAMLVTWNPSTSIWMARKIWAPFLLWIGGAKLEVEGLEHVEPSRPTLYVSNHQSTIDIPALFVALPVNLRFIAKSQLQWVPVLGWYLWLAGHVFVDRSNRQRAIASLDRAAEKIRGGTSLIAFPEGTRSADGRILPFKKGAFLLAIKAGAAICPVTIEGSVRIMPKNSWRIQGGSLRVRVGAPIDTGRYAEEDRERLVSEVRSRIIEQSLALGGVGGSLEAHCAAPGPDGIGRAA